MSQRATPIPNNGVEQPVIPTTNLFSDDGNDDDNDGGNGDGGNGDGGNGDGLFG